jgi:hypothetical protein
MANEIGNEMNERFKLLKHQASVWCHENIPEQFSEETNGYGSAWEEKFAELIIRDCIQAIKNESKDSSDELEYGLRIAEGAILDHFGVEE